MIGSWRWNVYAAVAFALLIFFLSSRSNPIETAAWRTGISTAVAFAVTYVVRWMLGQAFASRAPADSAEESPPEGEGASADANKGRVIDAATPDDDGADLDFTPLSPPKLAKTDAQIDPELLAKALRHMSEE